MQTSLEKTMSYTSESSPPDKSIKWNAYPRGYQKGLILLPLNRWISFQCLERMRIVPPRGKQRRNPAGGKGWNTALWDAQARAPVPQGAPILIDLPAA